MKDSDDKKSLDQRIDEHNRNRVHSSETEMNDPAMTGDQRSSETHNTVSNQDGDQWGENRVSTSLNDD